MTLTKKHRKELIRLLGLLQTHLESAIESSLVPGANEAMDDEKDVVAEDRLDYQKAAAWITRLNKFPT